MKTSILSALAIATAVSANLNGTLTTSTILSTQVYTITSCAATVTNCPVGKVTSTVFTTTTICPVTAAETAAPPPTVTPIGPSTETFYSTQVYTITSCAATVTNCPVGKVSTTVYTSVSTPTSAYVVPPVSAVSSAAVTGSASSAIFVPSPTPASTTVSTSYGTAVPVPTQAANSTIIPYTGAASAQRVGGLFMAVGLAVALL